MRLCEIDDDLIVGSRVEFAPDASGQDGTGASSKEKFLPVWQQEARDENNKRRFHGAFTGGFSAGYWNTVGSAEGWAPAQFVSSRKNRAGKVEQNVENFMDDEDMQEYKMGGKKLVNTEAFASMRAAGGTKRLEPETTAQQQQQQQLSSSDFGLRQVMEPLVVEAKDTIGIQLLKLMGWKHGQGIGPRVKKPVKPKKKIGPAMPDAENQEMKDAKDDDNNDDNNDNDDDDDDDPFAAEFSFAPKDVKTFTIQHKDNSFGLGFDPHLNLPDFQGNVSKRVELDMHGKDAERRARISMRNAARDESGAFGVGVFEDIDDDVRVYGADNVEYDAFLDDEEENEDEQMVAASKHHKKTGKEKSSKKSSSRSKPVVVVGSSNSGSNSLCFDGRPPLSGFVLATIKDQQPKAYPPPPIPKDFKPLHVFAEPLKLPEWVQGGAEVANRRARLLGEEQLKKKEAINDSDRQQLSKQLSSKFTAAIVAEPVSQVFMDNRMFDDADKQARYEYFLTRLTAPREAVAPPSYHTLSPQQQRAEDEEFAAIASKFRRTYHEPEPTKPVETLVVTRTIAEFRPGKITCKRFNVPNPYLGGAVLSSKTPRFGMQLESLSLFSAPTASAIQHQTKQLDKDALVAEQRMAAATGTLSTLGKIMQQQGEQDRARGIGIGSSTDNKAAAATTITTTGDGQQPSVEEELEAIIQEEAKQMRDAKKAPADLFKAIFDDDDDEEEEDVSNVVPPPPPPPPLSLSQQQQHPTLASSSSQEQNVLSGLDEMVGFYSAMAAKKKQQEAEQQQQRRSRFDQAPRSVSQSAIDAVASLGFKPQFSSQQVEEQLQQGRAPGQRHEMGAGRGLDRTKPAWMTAAANSLEVPGFVIDRKGKEETKEEERHRMLQRDHLYHRRSAADEVGRDRYDDRRDRRDDRRDRYDDRRDRRDDRRDRYDDRRDRYDDDSKEKDNSKIDAPKVEEPAFIPIEHNDVEDDAKDVSLRDNLEPKQQIWQGSGSEEDNSDGAKKKKHSKHHKKHKKHHKKHHH